MKNNVKKTTALLAAFLFVLEMIAIAELIIYYNRSKHNGEVAWNADDQKTIRQFFGFHVLLAGAVTQLAAFSASYDEENSDLKNRPGNVRQELAGSAAFLLVNFFAFVAIGVDLYLVKPLEFESEAGKKLYNSGDLIAVGFAHQTLLALSVVAMNYWGLTVKVLQGGSARHEPTVASRYKVMAYRTAPIWLVMINLFCAGGFDAAPCSTTLASLCLTGLILHISAIGLWERFGRDQDVLDIEPQIAAKHRIVTPLKALNSWVEPLKRRFRIPAGAAARLSGPGIIQPGSYGAVATTAQGLLEPLLTPPEAKDPASGPVAPSEQLVFESKLTGAEEEKAGVPGTEASSGSSSPAAATEAWDPAAAFSDPSSPGTASEGPSPAAAPAAPGPITHPVDNFFAGMQPDEENPTPLARSCSPGSS